MPDSNDYAKIKNVSESECFERWKGIRWTPDTNNPERGTCDSEYDFDGWAAKYEGEEEE
ncbi:MAG TPA: hypothetical protein V6D33_13490 [Cyanophyceae cyanobacterium]